MALERPVGIGRPQPGNTNQTLQRIVEVLNGLQGVEGLARRAVRFQDLLDAGVITRNQNGVYAVATPSFPNHYQSPVTLTTSVAGLLKIDLSKGSMFIHQLTEDIGVIDFENLPVAGFGTAFNILFLQDLVTPRIVTGWPAAMKWIAGNTYVATAVAGSIDEVGVTYYSSIYPIGKWGADAS